MRLHLEARDQIAHHLENEAFLLETGNKHLVSLGDLGANGIAGTTHCFEHAREYLDGFGVPYSLVAGNHDLEGLDEFDTDEENLLAWQGAFGMEQPQFCVQISKDTICVGLSTVRFRDAKYSSHEVFIDDAQLDWFEGVLKKHPDAEGWKVLVFTHAPPIGSGLRVVQEVHIKNGCAWLNHSETPERRRRFFDLACRHKCIKAWFSGHFHLSHDYEDSVSVVDGCSCAFVQVGVIGQRSTRDGRRHTRLVRGTESGLQVYTIAHHQATDPDGMALSNLRLDVSIDYTDPTHPVNAHPNEDYDHENWFSAYTPMEEDGCYLKTDQGFAAAGPHDSNAVCWWHMADGAVLGVHDGMIVEYDSKGLSPLGIVCTRQELHGREVVVAEGGRALMLVPWQEGADPSDFEVIHPNEDGSYWRKFQRNKRIRTSEKRREQLAREWLEKTRNRVAQ